MFDEVVLFNCAFAIGGFDFASNLGHFLVDFAIIGVFVLQTAHKATTNTAYLLRVEGEALDFGHFDGHLFKVGQVSGATAGASTRRKSATHFCVVTLVDLSEFNAHLEDGCQNLDKLSKIHSAFCSKVEDEL